MNIRQEIPGDYEQVEELVRVAFLPVKESDGTEPLLVQRLRKGSSFIPELSLVAEEGGVIIGHILLSVIQIQGDGGSTSSLILAPLAVLPDWQKKGVGGALIKKAHEIAAGLGLGSVIVIGHEHYYPRFGYRLAKDYHLRFDFEVPDVNAMALELIPGAFPVDGGLVVLSPEFDV